MSLEFFSKDVIGSLKSIFFKKQNKTKQSKANKAKQSKKKQGRYYFNRVEIRIGFIIVMQMHHQLSWKN